MKKIKKFMFLTGLSFFTLKSYEGLAEKVNSYEEISFSDYIFGRSRYLVEELSVKNPKKDDHIDFSDYDKDELKSDLKYVSENKDKYKNCDDILALIEAEECYGDDKEILKIMQYAEQRADFLYNSGKSEIIYTSSEEGLKKSVIGCCARKWIEFCIGLCDNLIEKSLNTGDFPSEYLLEKSRLVDKKEAYSSRKVK